MSNMNQLSGRDKELMAIAEQYEAAMADNQPFYLDADDLADLADWYGSKKKYEKAIEIAEYGLQLHPGNTELLIEYGYLHLDSGKRDKAREIIDSINDDYSPEAIVLRAHMLISDGELSLAEQLLDKIEDKEDLANVVDVSYMYIDTGLPDKAMEWLEPVKERYKDKDAYIAVVADCLYNQGLIEEAIPMYNKLIDIDPYSAPAWYGLAKCYFDDQNYEQAIDACEYALIGDDEFTDAYSMKGHCFYQLRNMDAALECYRKAEELHGLTPEFVLTFTGLCYLAKGDWEDALKNLEEAIRINGETDNTDIILPSLYTNAALCLDKLGKARKAHQYCKKAQKLAPDDSEAYLIEGRIYMNEDEYEKGIKQWKLALKCAPYAETWNEIGIHCMEIGYLEYARMAFEHVCELDPDFLAVNEKLAILCMTLHDKENFLKYNEKCHHPFQVEELERLQTILENNDREDLVAYMQNIIKALK